MCFAYLCLALFKIYSIYRLEKTPVKHLIFYVLFFFSAARLKFSIFYLLQDDYNGMFWIPGVCFLLFVVFSCEHFFELVVLLRWMQLKQLD